MKEEIRYILSEEYSVSLRMRVTHLAFLPRILTVKIRHSYNDDTELSDLQLHGAPNLLN